ncbi:uncharacterized protein LOC117938246 [Etheostoma cragini]|uniref:uncharacterized protein LOC117938246 n=1 Tax=Etheostoma cragini TaxID=417921 RepID=UPI00155EFEE8|nr:uncharacterized protein LOC117938246 [Etheostoma cragini]
MPKRARIPPKKMRMCEPEPVSLKDDQDVTVSSHSNHLCTAKPKFCGAQCHSPSTYQVISTSWATAPAYNKLLISTSWATAPAYTELLISTTSWATAPAYTKLLISTSWATAPAYTELLISTTSWATAPAYTKLLIFTSRPELQPLSTQPLDFSCPPIPPPITLRYSCPQYPQPHIGQRMPPDQLQQLPVLVDLDQQWKSTTLNNLTAKESFLRMMYSPTVPKSSSTVHTEESQPSTSEYESSSSSSGSSADTYIIERDPLPEYGEPCVQIESREGRAWKPCNACQAEVAKLMEAKGKLEEVLCSISAEQLEGLQGFLNKVEKIHLQAGVVPTKSQSGKQQLYQGCGLFLSSTRLAAIHAEARKDCLRLFHLLFDEFFTVEECQNALAFGKHGKVPEGKAVLDKSKVDGILSKYISNFVDHCCVVDLCVFIHSWTFS